MSLRPRLASDRSAGARRQRTGQRHGDERLRVDGARFGFVAHARSRGVGQRQRFCRGQRCGKRWLGSPEPDYCCRAERHGHTSGGASSRSTRAGAVAEPITRANAGTSTATITITCAGAAAPRRARTRTATECANTATPGAANARTGRSGSVVRCGRSASRWMPGCHIQRERHDHLRDGLNEFQGR